MTNDREKFELKRQRKILLLTKLSAIKARERLRAERMVKMPTVKEVIRRSLKGVMGHVAVAIWEE